MAGRLLTHCKADFSLAACLCRPQRFQSNYLSSQDRFPFHINHGAINVLVSSRIHTTNADPPPSPWRNPSTFFCALLIYNTFPLPARIEPHCVQAPFLASSKFPLLFNGRGSYQNPSSLGSSHWTLIGLSWVGHVNRYNANRNGYRLPGLPTRPF
jgi:hypothetical protein